MKMKCQQALVFFVIVSHLFMAQSVFAQTDAASQSIDIHAPKIVHDPRNESVTGEEPVTITVRVSDDTAVSSVTLFYRSGGIGEYAAVAMNAIGGDRFEAIIPADQIEQPNIEYYIQAVDVAGNTISRAGKLFPLRLAVVPVLPGQGAIGGDLLAEADTASSAAASQASEKNTTWRWVLGALAVGALVAFASSGGGGGGSGDDNPPAASTGMVQITGPAPAP